MRTIGLSIQLFILAGCTTTGGNNFYSPPVYAKPYPTSVNHRIATNEDNTVLQSSDIRAINASIVANEQQFAAPQEEVLQQELSGDLW